MSPAEPDIVVEPLVPIVVEPLDPDGAEPDMPLEPVVPLGAGAALGAGALGAGATLGAGAALVVPAEQLPVAPLPVALVVPWLVPGVPLVWPPESLAVLPLVPCPLDCAYARPMAMASATAVKLLYVPRMSISGCSKGKETPCPTLGGAQGRERRTQCACRHFARASAQCRRKTAHAPTAKSPRGQCKKRLP